MGVFLCPNLHICDKLSSYSYYIIGKYFGVIYMLNLSLLEQLLVVSVPCGVIAMTFIQKTKMMFQSSKIIILYSFIINMLLGVVFTFSFGSSNIIEALWIGLFSFLEADTLYRTLEGKLMPFSELKGNEIKYDL